MQETANFGKQLVGAAFNEDFVEGPYLGAEVTTGELKARARGARRTMLDEFHVIRFLMRRLDGGHSKGRDMDFVEGRFYLENVTKGDVLDRLNVARQRISDAHRVRGYCLDRVGALAAA
ncbi:hypothetical protein [Geomonas ferrireducens]|uniref:hypothetical protein n=1 Tax=Geomonas ferrireducens TaxID=2570227 RepID=UPI0010A8F1A9|nr:hypothetical protein [Geomonas ferrireducens]